MLRPQSSYNPSLEYVSPSSHAFSTTRWRRAQVGEPTSAGQLPLRPLLSTPRDGAVGRRRGRHGAPWAPAALASSRQFPASSPPAGHASAAVACRSPASELHLPVLLDKITKGARTGFLQDTRLICKNETFSQNHLHRDCGLNYQKAQGFFRKNMKDMRECPNCIRTSSTYRIRSVLGRWLLCIYICTWP